MQRCRGSPSDPQLRPERAEAVAGLFAVTCVEQHDGLADPGHDGVLRHLLPLHHYSLLVARPTAGHALRAVPSDANAGSARNRSDTGSEERPVRQPRSGMRQSIGWCPWAATASLICVKGREPKNFLAESGEGWAPFTTMWRSSSISGSFFCA
ncbi:hypothetical protein SCALM49S_04292 [Streptomyces californicus]